MNGDGDGKWQSDKGAEDLRLHRPSVVAHDGFKTEMRTHDL